MNLWMEEWKKMNATNVRRNYHLRELEYVNIANTTFVNIICWQNSMVVILKPNNKLRERKSINLLKKEVKK